MNKVQIIKGEHSGKKAILLNKTNKIATIQLVDSNETISISEDDIEPI